MMRVYLSILILAVVCLAGCTVLPPETAPETPSISLIGFNSGILGQDDYGRWMIDQRAYDRFVRLGEKYGYDFEVGGYPYLSVASENPMERVYLMTDFQLAEFFRMNERE